MNILITGGAGFIGFASAVELINKGHDVTILDKVVGGRNELNWNMAKQMGIPRIHANINDLNILPELINIGKDFDAILHCAAQTAVTHSLEDPRADFIDNARGTFEVCEYARKNDLAILYTSTNKVYGENPNKVQLVEQDTRYEYGNPKFCIDETFLIDLTGHTPYGTSKLTADLYVQDYRYTYGLRTLVFRQSCIYGTSQQGTEDQGWVSHMVKSWVNRKPIKVFGNGKQVRDMLHVDDLTDLIIKGLESDRSGVFNVGGSLLNTISILELFELLNKLAPREDAYSFFPWREGDQKVFICNIRKVIKQFDWIPKISPVEGITHMVRYEEMLQNAVKVR